ncbi:MAG: prenyltransferase/squalene oxidase repeat-containing protein, partial [Minisyncoccia bacterium]
YLSQSKLKNPMLTDYERRAMALMSLGLNPYNTNGENYIKRITDSFDGAQFGDANEDNDDIFAMIVLLNAGYDKTDPMIQKDLSFVISKQTENRDGSFDHSVDLTGAALEMLANFKDEGPAILSIKNAENFLKNSQKNDGSWNDSASSTAWAIEGITALGENTEDWKINGITSLDYLASVQDTDGGIKSEDLNNRIWETAYVVSALSGKTWKDTMQSFEKVETPTPVDVAIILPQAKPKAEISKITKPKSVALAKNDTSKTEPENTNTANALYAIQNVDNVPLRPAPQENWFIGLLNIIFWPF